MNGAGASAEPVSIATCRGYRRGTIRWLRFECLEGYTVDVRCKPRATVSTALVYQTRRLKGTTSTAVACLWVIWKIRCEASTATSRAKSPTPTERQRPDHAKRPKATPKQRPAAQRDQRQHNNDEKSREETSGNTTSNNDQRHPQSQSHLAGSW